MKTSTATINIVLLAKPDRTGLHPVIYDFSLNRSIYKRMLKSHIILIQSKL